jgi:hypothetical protein
MSGRSVDVTVPWLPVELEVRLANVTPVVPPAVTAVRSCDSVILLPVGAVVVAASDIVSGTLAVIDATPESTANLTELSGHVLTTVAWNGVTVDDM